MHFVGPWAKEVSSQILWYKKIGKSGKLPLQTTQYKSVHASAA